jgi:phosphatidylglycerol:prolipoprotein diacylglycerol transferase
MYPSFDIGPLSFPAYYTLLMFGYMFVVWLGTKEAVRLGMDGNKILDLSMVLLIAGIVGARILHVIADGYFWDYVHLCTDPFKVEPKMLKGNHPCIEDAQCVKQKLGEICNTAAGTCHPARDCLRALKIWYGGLAYYGGLICAFFAGLWYVNKKNIPAWKIGDTAGWAIPLGLVFGRIGCFLAGCCFGKTCTDFFCMVFPKGSPAWDRHKELNLLSAKATESLPVFPSQIFEAAGCLIIFLFLYIYLRPRKKFHGQVFFTMTILYSVLRFILEYFRDDPRGELFGLSTSQLLGIPIVIFSVYMLVRLDRSARHNDT